MLREFKRNSLTTCQSNWIPYFQKRIPANPLKDLHGAVELRHRKIYLGSIPRAVLTMNSLQRKMKIVSTKTWKIKRRYCLSRKVQRRSSSPSWLK
jgi:hypothetical protein